MFSSLMCLYVNMSCVHERTWCVFVYKHKVHICGVCVNFRHLYNVTLSVELVALTTPLKHGRVLLKSLQRPWRCSLRCTVWRRARLRFGVLLLSCISYLALQLCSQYTQCYIPLAVFMQCTVHHSRIILITLCIAVREKVDFRVISRLVVSFV